MKAREEHENAIKMFKYDLSDFGKKCNIKTRADPIGVININLFK